MVTRDTHEILFNRIEWESRPQAYRLRHSHFLRPTMRRPVHEALHRDVPCVPLLATHSLDYVVHNMRPANTTFQAVDFLLLAIDESLQHPRISQIEKEIGAVTIHAIEAQIPLIREGIVL